MGCERSLFLLSLMMKEADEDRREKLIEHFEQIISQSVWFQRLRRLVSESTFLGYDGYLLGKEASELLENTLENPGEITENHHRLDLLFQQIKNEAEASVQLLHSASFFDDDLVVVYSNLLSPFLKFYQSLAQAICYLLVSSEGVEAIQNLTFNYGANLSELSQLINQEYAGSLFCTGQRISNQAWAISEVIFSEGNVIEHHGFQLTPFKEPFTKVLHEVKEGIYRRVSPFLFVRTNQGSEPLYIGFGYLVGVEVKQALSLLGAGILTSLPVEAFLARDIRLIDPLDEIKNSMGTDCYVISPYDLLNALNRWSMERTVLDRRKAGQCVFCGTPLAHAGVACGRHFSIDWQND